MSPTPRLSTAALDRMGAVVATTFDQVATIKRPTTTTGHSGSTTTWNDVATNVDCSVAPANLRPVEEAVAGRVAATMPWNLSFPRGTDCRSLDHVLVSGRTFKVVGPRAPRTFELEVRVTAEEVK